MSTLSTTLSKLPEVSSKTKAVATTVLTTVLLGLSIYTYGNFAGFRPQIPEAHKQVKGISTQERTRLPYPENYEIIGISKEDTGEHITYKTASSQEAVQLFYRNILIPNDWEVSSKGSSGIFTTTKYKQQKKEIEITTSYGSSDRQNAENVTLVSLLIKD